MMSDAPQQPRRRPVAPVSSDAASSAPAPRRRPALPPQPAVPAAREEPPPRMERPRLPDNPEHAAAKKKPKTGTTWPRWLIACLAAAFLGACALVTAEQLMRAWLTQRENERAQAYQRVVEAHPLNRYRAELEAAAEEFNLNPAYVAAIVLNESSFKPQAVSGKGARGLMQIMEDTGTWIARSLKVSGYSQEMLFDPAVNLRFGCWYLDYLSREFNGDPVLVTSAYHAGQGNVRSWLGQKKVSDDGRTIAVDRIPTDDTKTYVRRVTRDYGIYQALYYPAADGADPGAADPAGGNAGG